jgi:hypothetical protein
MVSRNERWDCAAHVQNHLSRLICRLYGLLSGNLADMPTPFESAQLILTLYEQRREETMRKARNYWVMFDPETIEDFMGAMMGPDSGYIRMVIGYWEMAASLVENNAIDRKMFQDSTSEYLVVFAKLEPLLPALRQKFDNPRMGMSLEHLALSLPDARQQIDAVRARIKGMIAARKAAATA